MKSHLSLTIATVLGFLLAGMVPANAHAQDKSDFSQLQTTLKQNDKLTVTTDAGIEVKGKLISASPDQIVLNLKGQPQQIPASKILRVQRKRNGVLLGALIGMGAGILPAVMLSEYTSNEGGNSAAALVPIGLGAAIGIGVDALLAKNHTMYQRNPNQRLTLSPVLDRNRVGARVAWRF
jgi:hypothetical protein